jgi:hypothetical protein
VVIVLVNCGGDVEVVGEFVAKFPLTKTTRTAAYAAAAAKTSCLLALVKGAKDPAKAMVRPLSIPSLALGLLTQ